MRSGTFTERLDVAMSEGDRNLRGRQAARQGLAIEAQKKRAKDAADKWKEQKKSFETEEEEMVSALYTTSRAAETGVEKREVACEENLVGHVVITRRLDTGETVGSRAATKDELRPVDRPKANGAAKGYTAEELTAKLARLIGEHCAKPRAKSLLIKALRQGCPQATPLQAEAAIEEALATGKIEELDGKLVVVVAKVDDGIVDDSYVPDPVLQ